MIGADMSGSICALICATRNCLIYAILKEMAINKSTSRHADVCGYSYYF